MANIKHRLQQLQTLLKIKENDKDKALKQFAQAKDQVIHLKSQLDKMLQYRQDYQKQMNELGAQGCSINQMKSRVLFIKQIESGIQQINQQIAIAAKQRESCELNLLDKQKKVQSIEKLLESGEIDLIKLQNQIEQKENDEYATKQWYSE